MDHDSSAAHSFTSPKYEGRGRTGNLLARGGDIGPYIIAMLGVVIAIALPWGLLDALADT